MHKKSPFSLCIKHSAQTLLSEASLYAMKSSLPLFSECLLLEPSVGDNLTLGRSSSRHSTLEADQINHLFWVRGFGSSLSVCLFPDSQSQLRKFDPSFSWSNKTGAPGVRDWVLLMPLSDSYFQLLRYLFLFGRRHSYVPVLLGAATGSNQLILHLSSQRKTLGKSSGNTFGSLGTLARSIKSLSSPTWLQPPSVIKVHFLQGMETSSRHHTDERLLLLLAFAGRLLHSLALMANLFAVIAPRPSLCSTSYSDVVGFDCSWKGHHTFFYFLLDVQISVAYRQPPIYFSILSTSSGNILAHINASIYQSYFLQVLPMAWAWLLREYGLSWAFPPVKSIVCRVQVGYLELDMMLCNANAKHRLHLSQTKEWSTDNSLSALKSKRFAFQGIPSCAASIIGSNYGLKLASRNSGGGCCWGWCSGVDLVGSFWCIFFTQENTNTVVFIYIIT
ncbi:hypothetical protein Tco_1507985 [Tanacetum coccineum]